MKINSITANSYINRNNGQKRINYQTVTNCSDVLQISFSAKKKSREDIVKDFSKDVRKYFFEEKFDFKSIEKVAQKNIKGIKVNNFDELPSDFKKRLPKSFSGLFMHFLQYDEISDKLTSTNKAINLPDYKKTAISNLDSYAITVHEFTHAVQEEFDESSDTACLNKLYKNSKYPKEVKLKTVKVVNDFAAHAEERIKAPLNGIKNNAQKNEYYANKGANLSEVYGDLGIKDVKKFAIDTIKGLVNEFNEKHGELDNNMLIKFTIHKFKNENEAYQYGYDSIRSVFPNATKTPTYWNTKPQIQLYRILANIKY